MTEVKVIGEELSGLGVLIKQIVDENIKRPEVWKGIKNIKGTVVLREADSGVAVSLLFDRGRISIRNHAVDSPSAYLEAGFEAISEIGSGQVGPIRAIITRKIKAGGNLWKLLKMSKVLITGEEPGR